MSLILANAFGFVTAHLRWFVVGGLIVALVVLIFAVRSCPRREVKIDQEQIERINTANESQRKKELQAVIEENSTVIETVDNRTTIAEANVVERNRKIDEKVKQADAAVQDAKRQGRDVTAEELECILLGGCE